MNYLKKIFYKNNFRFRAAIHYNDIKLIAMEYQEKHIEADIKNNILKWRNVISPKDSCLPFPNGYFDANSSVLGKETILYAKEIILECLSRLSFKQELVPLPPGAVREAYLRLENNTGKNFYYTNTHTSDRGFSVETETVSDSFIELFSFFRKLCSFPQ